MTRSFNNSLRPESPSFAPRFTIHTLRPVIRVSSMQPIQANSTQPALPIFGKPSVVRARRGSVSYLLPTSTPHTNNCSGIPTTQPSALDALLQMWSKFGSVLAEYDPDWVFPELFGVPDFTDSEGWNQILIPLAQTVRQVAPAHTIIADGNSGSFRVDWNSITALSYLQTVPNERNVIYGFIFYDPVIFTHQGATWRPEWPELQYIKGVPYPSSPALVAPALPAITDSAAQAEVVYYGLETWGPELLSIGLDQVADWSAQNCSRVICVEFGVYRQYAPADSAARWVHDARTLLEERRIAWSYFTWGQNQYFAIEPPQPGPIIVPAIATSLGLTE